MRINSKCKNRILIDDQELKEVDKYNYLGANVSKQGGGGDDDGGGTEFVKLGYLSCS